ncbi:hypothetical protein NP493_307g02022 [Ridgeia piscesae]|uniref:Cyclin-H n=1 Tax=Ridgeia piscesae TaxID=27915 RepID=A0AAD9NW50_RIDPI|nr:hypothetical protein NP493_307g02022 [Ridgeia piscesae]
MFPSSTQLKFWTYSGTAELNRLRIEANQQFVQKYGREYNEVSRNEFFLNTAEETKIRRHYEYVLKEFCNGFQPTMPRYVLGTAMMYLKRFYLHNSVMNFHPEDIVYTCVYLACKVEEFNVSILQFVANVKSKREEMAEMILSQELLLMHELHYHLTVHGPLRPLEGLFIDIKTRCPDVLETEQLRRGAEDFIDRSFHTDACLIFAPSQIALAALLSCSSKFGLNLDSYVANKLVVSSDKEDMMKMVENIKRINLILKTTETLDRGQVKELLAEAGAMSQPGEQPQE